MRRGLYLLFSLVFTAFMLPRAQSVQALVTPSFPACANPQGTVIVSYPSGVHGIPGDTNSYTGSDTVYTLTDTTYSQCFCAEDGTGIQSNWWEISSLTQNEINQLVSQGWVYVPNGAVWGLKEAEYLVENMRYNCKPGKSGTGGGSGGSNSGGGGVGGGSVSLASGEVLGLATTGDSRLAWGLLALTLVSLLGAFVYRNHV